MRVGNSSRNTVVAAVVTLTEQVVVSKHSGERRFNMPGSVGNTTSTFRHRGLVNVTLCDGPAGIRVQKRSAVMKDGSIKAVDPAFSFMNMLPGVIKKKMLADLKKRNGDLSVYDGISGGMCIGTVLEYGVGISGRCGSA